MRLVSTVVVMWFAGAAAQAQPALSPPAQDSAYDMPAPPTHREYAVGYRRGSGLGWYGAEAMWAATPELSSSLTLFGQLDDGDRGFAIQPAVRYGLSGRYQTGPYFEAGAAYSHIWFGDAGGGTLGGFAAFGFEWRLTQGLGFDIGAGLNGRGAIHAMQRTTRLDQPASFGVHWNAALRYWLP